MLALAPLSSTAFLPRLLAKSLLPKLVVLWSDPCSHAQQEMDVHQGSASSKRSVVCDAEEGVQVGVGVFRVCFGCHTHQLASFSYTTTMCRVVCSGHGYQAC